MILTGIGVACSTVGGALSGTGAGMMVGGMKLGVNEVNATPSGRPTEGDATPPSGLATRGDTPRWRSKKTLVGPRPATALIAEAHQDNLATIAIVAAGAAWWALR